MRGMKKLEQQNNIDKRLCEGSCKRHLPEEDLDMVDGKFICRECENEYEKRWKIGYSSD
jgi:hypothetical protein